MNKNLTYEKALAFAVRIVNLYKFLIAEKKEFVISKQLLRSGTSIGANISEAISAESLADFIHKLTISLKEANETTYWLTLLKRTEYLSDSQFQSIQTDCIEIRKILASIIITSKRKQKRNHKFKI